MNRDQFDRLEALAKELGSTIEASIIFAMLGNICAGVSNAPIAEAAARGSEQILRELKP